MSAVVADAGLPARTRSLGWLRERGMGASILVAVLAAAFGVFLVEVTGYIGAMLKADQFIGGSEMLALVVAILSVVLVALAMYIAAIVTANTFTTIIAGASVRSRCCACSAPRRGRSGRVSPARA